VDTFCVSSSVLGTDSHFVVAPDGFSTVKNPPRDAWYFNGDLDPTKPLCFDTLLRLHKVTVPSAPPDKWANCVRAVTSGSLGGVPWSRMIPPAVHKLFLKNLINSLAEAMGSLSKDYYTDVWGPSGRLLSSLKAAKVDGSTYRAIADSVERDSGALATFAPGPGGFLPPVVYDRFATRTGRLTVESGPNILTLKKEYRKVLKSMFPDGSICSLDFSALEARILLAEAGREAGGADVYAAIAQELFGGKLTRDAVKTAVISELYGASRASLAHRLGVSDRKLDEFSAKIRSHFGTAELRKRLKDEYSKTGKIRNRHGRHLELDDPQDHLFVNTYAQSTGVDVSLLGFKAVMDRLGEDGVRPLFVLHDALILDVRGDRLRDVEACDSVSVLGYEHFFPLKLEKVAG
jgi:DNA polymerase family A